MDLSGRSEVGTSRGISRDDWGSPTRKMPNISDLVSTPRPYSPPESVPQTSRLRVPSHLPHDFDFRHPERSFTPSHSAPRRVNEGTHLKATSCHYPRPGNLWPCRSHRSVSRPTGPTTLRVFYGDSTQSFRTPGVVTLKFFGFFLTRVDSTSLTYTVTSQD